MEYTKESVIAACKEHAVLFINLQFSDILGAVKSITVPVTQLEGVLDNGIWFDGSSIQGFARISESDMYLFPDCSTFAILPWKSGVHQTARLICDVFTPDAEPFKGSPRTVLANALAEAADMGFCYRVGPELEFFLFGTDELGNPIPGALRDNVGYFDASSDSGVLVRQDMITALQAFGIHVETGHHEVAQGQHEIDFKYGDALKAADSAVTFKYVLKAIARQHGLHATFMPKPIRGINGSGMHCHQSLAGIEGGATLFHDPKDPYGLSKLAKHFIAGQLKHARALSAVIAPLVNSYKRLVPGYEAPVYISWARINRSALIRIPRAMVPEATRCELRCPDPACNPYLAFAVMLKAGLDGIKNELPLPAASEENLYEDERARVGLATLPGSLREALDALAEDTVIQEALGPHVYEKYVEAKTAEWEDYCLSVSGWELDRYLKAI
ncbi:MAG: type I glutamate--ammonia ligase [Chloroflexi bacterium]|nr:type I glutamate--ammonia ligase [Chloroflexota bacterium]